jgi:hypothetical protein
LEAECDMRRREASGIRNGRKGDAEAVAKVADSGWQQTGHSATPLLEERGKQDRGGRINIVG